GSSPSTDSWPSQSVSPSTAFSRVVFPAPFGPIRPMIFPFSISKLTSSTARTGPNDFDTLRALTRLVIVFSFGRSACVADAGQQHLRIETQSFDRCGDLRPFLLDEALPFVL